MILGRIEAVDDRIVDLERRRQDAAALRARRAQLDADRARLARRADALVVERRSLLEHAGNLQ